MQRTRQCARAFHWSASQRTASGRCAIATPVTRENMCRVEVRTMSSTWPSPMCGQVTPKRKGIWPRLSWGLYSEARNTRMFPKNKKDVHPPFSLLKEAQPLDKRSAELGGSDQWHAHSDDADSEQLARGRLLSRYGIWLLVELCPPNDNADVETLGRLISMLFQVLCRTIL